jgi:hypothetical protein
MPASVPNPSSNPAFEARPLTSASGWYVRVAWLNGKRDHIPGFASRQEAQRWIEEKATPWLSAHSKASEPYFWALATRSQRPGRAENTRSAPKTAP